jgi:hypothetical protein
LKIVKGNEVKLRKKVVWIGALLAIVGIAVFVCSLIGSRVYVPVSSRWGTTDNLKYRITEGRALIPSVFVDLGFLLTIAGAGISIAGVVLSQRRTLAQTNSSEMLD